MLRLQRFMWSGSNSELPQENGFGCIADPIVILEIFRDHDTAIVQYICSRIGNAEAWRFLGYGLVEDAVAADHLGLRIGEQRETNVFPVGESLHDIDAVVADRRKTEAPLLDTRAVLFQLDQLGFAVRSPIGRAIENEQRALGTQDRTQRALRPVLIGQPKIGDR